MRKEVTALRSEREQLRTALDAALSEVQALKEVTLYFLNNSHRLIKNLLSV